MMMHAVVNIGVAEIFQISGANLKFRILYTVSHSLVDNEWLLWDGEVN